MNSEIYKHFILPIIRYTFSFIAYFIGLYLGIALVNYFFIKRWISVYEFCTISFFVPTAYQDQSSIPMPDKPQEGC